jgi:hypothetical protein
LKAIWLLDIDGVLNCGNRTPPTHLPFNFLEFKQRASDGILYNIIVAKEVVDFIDEMSDFFQVVWCTTWQAEANIIGKRVGLKEFPWIDETKIESPYHWKRAAFEKLQKAKHPIVWTDDQIRSFYNYPAKVEFDNTCIIQPSLFEGLCPRHLDKIREFRGKLSL